MLMPYILILFLASIATFYKLDKMLAGQKIWTRNFRIKLISSLQRWYFVDYLAFIIIFSILSLVVLVLIHESGSRPPKIIPQSIFLVICASTIIFATIHYNLREYYKKHSGTVKIVLTATTVVFTIMANSLTEDAIINYTHVDASHFPGAQKAFILIGTVLLWLYIGMYASLPAYFFVLAKLMKTFVHNERNKPSYVNSYTTPFNNIKRNFNLIQRLIDGDFAEHHDLGDAQCGFAVWGVEHGGEVEEHFAGGAEGFAGVGEQGFAVVLRVGEVHAFGLLGAGHDLAGGFEVVVEGAFGGFVESLGRGIRRGMLGRFLVGWVLV
jgi:hypothetical protein